MIDQRKEIEHMKTIGIGIQDFAKIADKNMFYIDKTAFLKEWWENQDSVTLITRPRRFGKTLLMSMTARSILKAWTSGKKKNSVNFREPIR